MKKTILASVAATALFAGISVAGAEPGEDAYFHERGNINAAQMRGPAPDLNGWPQYGYQPGPAYQQGPLGYAPDFDDDYYN